MPSPTNIWTLTYLGTEKTLAAWGVRADIALAFRNKEKDTVTLTTTEPFDPAAAQFAWGEPVLIQRDRILTGSTWSGGSIAFYGYVGDLKMQDDGGNQAIGYSIYGPWWLLLRQIFMQTRQVFNGWRTPGVPTSGLAPLVTLPVAETYLGENTLATYWTGTMTICEVLLYANECFNPTKRGASSGRDASKDILQIGGSVSLESIRSDLLNGTGTSVAGVGLDEPTVTSIDCHTLFPKQRAQTTSCAEAIIQVLRYFPTCVCWFDYTTTIVGLDSVSRPVPTLWIKDISNLSNVALDLPTDGTGSDVSLAPDYERELPGVVICYKQTQFTNGIPFPALYYDCWPATVISGGKLCWSGSPPVPVQWLPFVLHHTAEIPGASATWVSSTPAVLSLGYDAGVNAFASALADLLDFWAAFEHALLDLTVDTNTNTGTRAPTLAFGAVSVVDGNDNPVNVSASGGFPNILRPGGGQLYPWMAQFGVKWVEATVSVPVTFTKYRAAVCSAPGVGISIPSNAGTPTVQTRVLSQRVWLTNASGGAYEALSASDTGEFLPPMTAPPTGSTPTTANPLSLAYTLYNNLSILQYKGKITTVGVEAASTIRLGITLSLEGPNNTYTGLLIQGVTIRPHTGQVDTEVGPCARLDVGTLIEMWRITRTRTLYNMPSGRQSGISASAGIDQTGATPKENTLHGPSDYGRLLIS